MTFSSKETIEHYKPKIEDFVKEVYTGFGTKVGTVMEKFGLSGVVVHEVVKESENLKLEKRCRSDRIFLEGEEDE